MPTNLISCKSTTYVALASAAMTGTMLTTYHLCVHANQCPALPKLPTISNTWDNAPGNYLSRFVISHVALAMVLAQWVIWTPLAKVKKCEKLCLGLGVFAVFCLSVVGAICDDNTNPQCMGNNMIHSISAVTFFVLYNINMCLLSCKKKKKSTSHCHRNILIVLTLISFVTKARFLVPYLNTSYAIGDQTPLALFEWTDTFTIIGWTVFYICKNRTNFSLRLRIEDTNDNDEDNENEMATTETTETTAMRFSLYNITWTVLAMTTLTLCVCFYFLDKAGSIPKGSWPYISDMFVVPPGNWISRWSLVFGSTLSGFAQVCLYYLDGKTTFADKALTALSCISVLGLSGVGCINEKENHTLHILCAGTFFIGYDLFMILRTVRKTVSLEMNKMNALLGCIAVVSSLLTWVRFFTSGQQVLIHFSGTDENVRSFIGPVLEWIDALLIINYLAFSIFANGKSTVSKYGLAIVSMQEDEDEDEDMLAVPLTKSINYSQMI